MSTDSDLQSHTLLEKFFQFIQSEDFEQCFHWVKTESQLQASPVQSLIAHLEEDPVVAITDGEELAEQDKLLLFCGCYSYARYLVEESNWYSTAETLVRSSIIALDLLSSAPINSILKTFAAIQIDICSIDRGIYTGQEWLMAQAAENITQQLATVSSFSGQFDEEHSLLLSKYLEKEFHAYRHFSEGVGLVAELYRIRWQEPAVLAEKMATSKPLFQAAVDALSAAGREIMGTDLAALWHPLVFFSEKRTTGSGELIVERGAIRMSYFATLNHVVTRKLRKELSDIVSERASEHHLHFQQWSCGLPQRNVLNDIWGGIAQDFEDVYSWNLPELSMPFRDRENNGKQLLFAVQLIYYPMGIFALHFRSPLNDVSATGVRHAMSLGTPFAMDQEMCWNNEDVGLLDEFVDERFNELDEMLTTYFDQIPDFDYLCENDESLLQFNTVENRFVATRIDTVVESADGGRRGLSARDFKDHIAYPAFVLPQRELRSSVDDWCLRTIPSNQENINVDCYNQDEFLYTNRHECVLGLLEQPSWAIKQCAEMMDVAAVITNMFHLTNTQLSSQLTRSLAQEDDSPEGETTSLKKLKEKIQNLEDEREGLRQFIQDTHWLLDLINAGRMMTFPDHARMVKKVFHHMDFENLHKQTQENLTKIHHRQEENIAETAGVYKQLQNRMNKRLTHTLSGVMALISVGTFKDIFDILNRNQLGIEISGNLQCSIIAFFSVMLILLFINKDNGSE